MHHPIFTLNILEMFTGRLMLGGHCNLHLTLYISAASLPLRWTTAAEYESVWHELSISVCTFIIRATEKLTQSEKQQQEVWCSYTVPPLRPSAVFCFTIPLISTVIYSKSGMYVQFWSLFFSNYNYFKVFGYEEVHIGMTRLYTWAVLNQELTYFMYVYVLMT